LTATAVAEGDMACVQNGRFRNTAEAEIIMKLLTLQDRKKFLLAAGLVAVADQPKESFRETVDSVSLKKIHGLRTVDLCDDDQQLSCPAYSNLTDAPDLRTPFPLRTAHVEDNSFKLPVIIQSL
jgi:hypothetical protein